MDVKKDIASFGVPDIKIAGLQLWIHNREYPEHHTFWDGNWLLFTALCEENGASVRVDGSHLRNTEIADWIVSLKTLNETLTGEINLETLEQGLSVKINPETMGRISVNIEITPDKVFQHHSFEFWLDQTYLNDLIESCQKVLKKFPIRENTDC